MNFQKKNENITNLIHHELIEGSFLFNGRFMQKFLSIYVIGKFKFSNMIYLSQDMHKVILVHLFILCTQSCNNNQITFCMHNVL